MSLNRTTKVLRYAICAAAQAHRPQQVSHLLASHHLHHFAQSLAGLPPRVIDDVMSMLSDQERQLVESQRLIHRPKALAITTRFLRALGLAPHLLNRFAVGGRP